MEPNTYSLLGTSPKQLERVIKVEGVKPYEAGSPLCVLPEYKEIVSK